VSGTAGVGIARNLDDTNVEAVVDGTITAAGSTVGTEIDRGSTFEVLVPRADRAEARPTIRSLVDKAPASSLDGTTILCIDNEHSILEGMQGLLSKWGASPLIANNSESALEHLRKMASNGGGCPSILLVDYHLANRVSGLDVMAGLDRELGCNVPAIVITADRSPQLEDAARARGYRLLRKPIRPAALRALMTNTLKNLS
ncbi:MAG: response regulator, partial [Xanthomonadales bacterium]